MHCERPGSEAEPLDTTAQLWKRILLDQGNMCIKSATRQVLSFPSLHLQLRTFLSSQEPDLRQPVHELRQPGHHGDGSCRGIRHLRLGVRQRLPEHGGQHSGAERPHDRSGDKDPAMPGEAKKESDHLKIVRLNGRSTEASHED